MRSEEFIALLTEKTTEDSARKQIREGVPLGLDGTGALALSQLREHAYTPRHTCVTGMRRTGFIRRLIATLSRLYDESEANFLVLSPRNEYGELLRLQNASLTVPFIRSKADLDLAFACVKELVSNASVGGMPRLFLVLDGLEELPECNANGALDEYRSFFELIAREKNVDIISGAELIKSIFSGNPGVFVGVGNCLVTTREEGKADVTYVGDDSSLSMPVAITYPDSPSVLETVIALNATKPLGGNSPSDGE